MLSPFHTDGVVECGVDEVGRGCVAGPVVAAGVIWDSSLDVSEHPWMKDIKDSKKLSAKKRQALVPIIKKHAIAWSIQFVDNTVIDEINILQATYTAMHMCVDDICSKHRNVEHILVDGNRFKPYNDVKHTCVVKGDNTYISIAAASILAKVARDEYMSSAPEAHIYKWDSNSGYGTAEHIRAIQKHGISSLHRRSFTIKGVHE